MLAAHEAQRKGEMTPLRGISPAATGATKRSPARVTAAERKKAKAKAEQDKSIENEKNIKNDKNNNDSVAAITNYRQAKATSSTVAKSLVGRLLSWIPIMHERDDTRTVPDCAGGLLVDRNGEIIKLKVHFGPSATFGRAEEGTEEPGAELCYAMPKLLGKVVRLDGVGLRCSDWQEGSEWVTVREKFVEGTHTTTVCEAVATTDEGRMALDTWAPLPEASAGEFDEDGYADYVASVVATPVAWIEFEARDYSTVKYDMVGEDGASFTLAVWSSVRDRRLLCMTMGQKYKIMAINHRRGFKAQYATCAYSCLLAVGEADDHDETGEVVL